MTARRIVRDAAGDHVIEGTGWAVATVVYVLNERGYDRGQWFPELTVADVAAAITWYNRPWRRWLREARWWLVRQRESVITWAYRRYVDGDG